MKNTFLTIVISCFLAINSYAADFVKYVNPLVGSQSKHSLSTGNTYPAIALPWGMNFWTPQTGEMGDGWAYTYDAEKIRGFKQTHQPSPWINDYGQFAIMPVTGKPVFDQNERASWFSHKAEVAQPHYYKVYLADYDVTTEITPTERAAMFRFTFPKSDQSYIVIDALDNGSYVKILPDKHTIIGYTTKNSGGVPANFKNYFVIQFDKTITYQGTFANGKLVVNRDEIQEKHTGAVIGFSTNRGEKVHARVASSFISFDQAYRNLNELGARDFDSICRSGRTIWNNVLSRVAVEDTNLDHLRTFYSCLYRSVLFPRSLYEFDSQGNPIHYSPYNGQVLPGYMFTDTGFWDTFRGLFPLLNFLYPSINQKIQAGLVNAYKESGFLPEWASPGHRGCMVGNNSASVVADAYLKGVRGYDIEKLYEAVLHGTENVHPQVSSTGRLGYQYYNKLGYVPCNVNIKENTARTLEYAFDDWSIYKLGQALGRPQKELDVFAKRALNYKNMFDPSTKLMRGKNDNGTFQTPFDPLKWGDAFTEGNSWHYSWSVFHDPQGLIDLMGGTAEFNRMLDSVFLIPPTFDISYYKHIIHEMREMQIMNMGQYAHGNQPIQHMLYLYNYSGQPWKAQAHIRNVMEKLYNANFDGYCGDEDNGQTSAWYVFSALGFYSVCPGSNQYVIGSPLFNKVHINLENGKQISIETENNSDSNVYISSIDLNGNRYDKNYLTHDDLNNGATIRYVMDAQPNTQRGISDDASPYSFSKELGKKLKAPKK